MKSFIESVEGEFDNISFTNDGPLCEVNLQLRDHKSIITGNMSYVKNQVLMILLNNNPNYKMFGR